MAPTMATMPATITLATIDFAGDYSDYGQRLSENASDSSDFQSPAKSRKFSVKKIQISQISIDFPSKTPKIQHFTVK
jgi:hypothetical protein